MRFDGGNVKEGDERGAFGNGAAPAQADVDSISYAQHHFWMPDLILVTAAGDDA